MKEITENEMMPQVIEALKKVSGDVWLNFKHHAEEYDPNHSDKFWCDWVSDTEEMDAAYKKHPTEYALYLGLINGLMTAVRYAEKTIEEKGVYYAGSKDM